MENIQQTVIDEEARQALNSPPQSAKEIFEGFQLWQADIKAGALQNFDELIQRDQGTPREIMWRTLRAGYEKLINEHKEHSNGTV